jgi:hypothetical protein
MENTKDLLTHEEFMKQGSNQKFAYSKNSIRYNNINVRKKRIINGLIDRMLDVNRTVLCWIIGDKQEIIFSRDYLFSAGFYFIYYLFNREIDGVNYNGIYDYGIVKISNDKFKTIKINHEKTS